MDTVFGILAFVFLIVVLLVVCCCCCFSCCILYRMQKKRRAGQFHSVPNCSSFLSFEYTYRRPKKMNEYRKLPTKLSSLKAAFSQRSQVWNPSPSQFFVGVFNLTFCQNFPLLVIEDEAYTRDVQLRADLTSRLVGENQVSPRSSLPNSQPTATVTISKFTKWENT